ncbi:MAG TPA: alpha/beta hydrolase [bacterium]
MTANFKLFEFNPGSSKPPLHFAHANGFPPETYKAPLEPLLPDYRVISLRARPLWGNTPPEWLKNWSQLADDLLEGLKESGIQKVVGVGHSLGGVATLYAALKQPSLFTHIVLIDPTMLSPGLLRKVRWMKLFGWEARNQLVEGALRRKRNWESVEAAYEYFKGKPLFKNWPDETIRAYAQSMTVPSMEGGVEIAFPPEWEARIYRTIPTDVWKCAKLLQHRVLVIRGENSNTFTAESEKAFREANPQAVFAVVPGAGHLVPQEKPEEVGRLILNFLR